MLLALDYTLEETQKILSELDFNNFMDDSWGVVRDTKRLIEKYGWYDDWHRTVYINTIGVNTTDFKLEDEKKEDLVKEGIKGVTKYFDWYDRFDPNNPPMNHPDFID